MKRYVLLGSSLVMVAVLLLLALAHEPGVITVTGQIRIPSADIVADVYSVYTEACDCCVELWQGGQVSTPVDLSVVNIDDLAYLFLLNGELKVLECIEITSCICIGRWLISWQGIVQANGDLIVFNNGTVYRFVFL